MRIGRPGYATTLRAYSIWADVRAVIRTSPLAEEGIRPNQASSPLLLRPNGETEDALDLGSSTRKRVCGFDSCLGYQFRV